MFRIYAPIHSTKIRNKPSSGAHCAFSKSIRRSDHRRFVSFGICKVLYFFSAINKGRYSITVAIMHGCFVSPSSRISMLSCSSIFHHLTSHLRIEIRNKASSGSTRRSRRRRRRRRRRTITCNLRG